MTTNAISLPISIQKSKTENVETLTLLDSGAGGTFINLGYAKQLKLPIQNLKNL